MTRDNQIERQLNVLEIVIENPMITVTQVRDLLASRHDDHVHERTVRRSLLMWERRGFLRCYKGYSDGKGFTSDSWRALARIVRT